MLICSKMHNSKFAMICKFTYAEICTKYATICSTKFARNMCKYANKKYAIHGIRSLNMLKCAKQKYAHYQLIYANIPYA